MGGIGWGDYKVGNRVGGLRVGGLRLGIGWGD